MNESERAGEAGSGRLLSKHWPLRSLRAGARLTSHYDVHLESLFEALFAAAARVLFVFFIFFIKGHTSSARCFCLRFELIEIPYRGSDKITVSIMIFILIHIYLI